MPLVWAHSEHIKLIRSLSDARVFDMPPQSVSRYLGAGTSRALRLWRTNNMSRTLAAGMQLRLELLQPATVHWSANNWLDTFDVESLDSPLGLSVVDLPTAELPPGTTIIFTWRTKADGAWLGSNHTLLVLNEISK
jgi:glucoamylase